MVLFIKKHFAYILKGGIVMKKVLCLFLIVTMVLTTFCVFADTDVSEDMERVLLIVKGKLDIPENLTKFVPRTRADLNRNKNFYIFTWEAEDGSSFMEVTCDSEGRINQYNFYDNTVKSEKKLTKLSKSEIIDYTDTFLQKIFPEVFGEDDKPVFCPETWSVSNSLYTMTYRRFKNGIEVNNNSIGITLSVTDDTIFIRNVNVTYDYDAEFAPPADTISDYNEKYKEAFPVEIIYKDEYSAARKNNTKTALLYRYKDSVSGYILASDGQTAQEDELDFGYLDRYMGVNKEMASDSMSGGGYLTEAEIKELKEIETLISADKARKILESLPYINLTKNMVQENFGISRHEDKYNVFVSYANEEDNRYISATFDGDSGKVLSIYNRAPYTEEKEITKAKEESAKKAIDKFLSSALPDYSEEFVPVSTDVYSVSVSQDYDRCVNGIRYVSDGLYVNFNAEENMITDYSLDYSYQKEFASPEDAIDNAAAADSLLKIAPLKKIYISVGGTYTVCYTVSKQGVEIDAYSGEEYLSNMYMSTHVYSYTDLEGHWIKEKAEKLAEVQIGFEGDKFNPSDAITQYDLLRLFASGIRYRSYLDYTEEELYRILESEGLFDMSEKAPGSSVTREDAFVYMVKLDGLDKVARLNGIFKVEYEDENLISYDKIGYPAILTGMGIICGNGGKLRPQDFITRAEAVSMVYNYMIQ